MTCLLPTVLFSLGPNTCPLPPVPFSLSPVTFPCRKLLSPLLPHSQSPLVPVSRVFLRAPLCNPTRPSPPRRATRLLFTCDFLPHLAPAPWPAALAAVAAAAERRSGGVDLDASVSRRRTEAIFTSLFLSLQLWGIWPLWRRIRLTSASARTRRCSGARDGEGPARDVPD